MTIPDKINPMAKKLFEKFIGKTWYEVVDSIGDKNPAKKQLRELPFTKENIAQIQSLVDQVGQGRRLALQVRLDQLAQGTSEEKPTPEGEIAAALKAIRSQLEKNLLEKLMKVPPASFERLTVELLKKMDYGNFSADAGKVIGKPGDRGIDGIIYEDKLGFDVVCIQAKKYTENTVPSKDIQAFYGALSGVAKKGVFITTSTFSGQAKEEAAKSIDPKIILIDGQELVKLMIDHGLGTIETTYIVQKIDEDFFEEYGACES